MPKKKIITTRHGVKLPAQDPTDLAVVHAGLPPNVAEALNACSIIERRFVREYVGSARGNQRLACKLAGFKGTEKKMSIQSSYWMTLRHVRKAIEVWMDAFALTGAQVTAQIADLAEANMGPFTFWNPKTKQVEIKTPDDATWEAHKHWIKAITTDPETGKVVNITLHDAAGAKRDLAKILKLYSDAPIFNLNLHMKNLTDEELLQQLHEVQAETVEDAGSRTKSLPPGKPVKVVAKP